MSTSNIINIVQAALILILLYFLFDARSILDKQKASNDELNASLNASNVDLQNCQLKSSQLSIDLDENMAKLDLSISQNASLQTRVDSLNAELKILKDKYYSQPIQLAARQYYDEMRATQIKLERAEMELRLKTSEIDSLTKKVIELNTLNAKLVENLSYVFDNLNSIALNINKIDNSINEYKIGGRKFDIKKETKENVIIINHKLQVNQRIIDSLSTDTLISNKINSTLATMQESINNKNNLIQHLDSMSNVKYVFCGTQAELKAKGLLIIDKKNNNILKYNIAKVNELLNQSTVVDGRLTTLSLPISNNIARFYPDPDDNAFRINTSRTSPSKLDVTISNNKNFWVTNFIIVETAR